GGVGPGAASWPFGGRAEGDLGSPPTDGCGGPRRTWERNLRPDPSPRGVGHHCEPSQGLFLLFPTRRTSHWSCPLERHGSPWSRCPCPLVPSPWGSCSWKGVGHPWGSACQRSPACDDVPCSQ